MDKKFLQHAFSQQKPSQSFETALLGQIEREIATCARRKRIASLVGMSLSFFAALWSAAVFGNAVLHSEFWSVVSLLFSDMKIVATHGSEYVFSLLETFPILQTIAVLTPLFVMFLCLHAYASTPRKDQFKYLIVT